MSNWRFFTAEEITKWYGPRCPDIEPGCVTCNAWLRYDTLRQWEFEDMMNRIDWINTDANADGWCCLENETNDEEEV